MIAQRGSIDIDLEYLIKLRYYLFVDQLINQETEMQFGLAVPVAVGPLDEPTELAPIRTLKISLQG